jgi:hypothetical protein
MADASLIVFRRLENCLVQQVAEGLPSLRLAAGRLRDFAHGANRRFLDRTNPGCQVDRLWPRPPPKAANQMPTSAANCR